MSGNAHIIYEPREHSARLTERDGLLSAAVNEVVATTTQIVIARLSQFEVVGNEQTHAEVEVTYKRLGPVWIWDHSAIVKGTGPIASVTHRAAAQAVANITSREVIHHGAAKESAA